MRNSTTSGIDALYNTMACNISHVKALQYAKDNNYPCVCIFEDDVELHENFKETLVAAMLELPNNWNMLYLSGTDAKKPLPYSKLLSKCICTYGAFGYIVNANIYDELIYNIGLVNRPNDDYLANIHMKINAFKLRQKNIVHLDGISDRMNKFVSYPHLNKWH